MIYDVVPSDGRIDQGDLIDGCPVVGVAAYRPADLRATTFDVTTERVIVLTQTCDLEQGKTDVAVVAVVEEAAVVVSRGTIKVAEARGNLLKSRVFGLYFLPADAGLVLPEMIADFRRLHTVRLDLPAALCRAGQRHGRVRPPYREHLSKHFADGYSRIGLPAAVTNG